MGNDTTNETINDTINETINDIISGDLTTDERLVLELLKKNGQKYIKQDMANSIGKSISTINRVIKSLNDKYT